MDNTIRMYPSGVDFNYADPQTNQVKLNDIAHHLSFEPRWCNASPIRYSVAQHCCMVSLFCEAFYPTGKAFTRAIIEAKGMPIGPRRLAMFGLAHDWVEAVMRDLPTQLKSLPELQGYKVVEERCQRVILKAYLGEEELPKEVKQWDILARDVEESFFVNPPCDPYVQVPLYIGHGMNVFLDKWPRRNDDLGRCELPVWTPERAEAELLARWRDLATRIGEP